MKDRIKEIRKEKKETQQAFAEKLNVSKSTIEAIEYGRRDATDRIVSDICRVYNINETWLRTGKGEMHVPLTEEAMMAELSVQIFNTKPTEFQKQMLSYILKMSEEKQELLYNMVKELYEAMESTKKNEPSN